MFNYLDPVIWYHIPKGGYGYGIRVLAKVLKVNTYSVRIIIYNKVKNSFVKKSVKSSFLRIPTAAEVELINQINWVI